MKYECERCGYISNHLANFRKHLERINTCEPVLNKISVKELLKKINKDKEFKCKLCSKSFTHKSSLYRHKKECDDTKKQINYLLEEIDKLKKQQKGNTTINNNCNNNYINITTYGTYKPSINYEQLEYLLKIGACKAIKTLIDKNHFNKNKPENMNFYISNYKDNIGRIFDGESWIIKDGDDLVDEIYDLYQSLVDNVIEELQCASDDEEEQKHKLLARMDDTIELWCKRTNNNKFINGIKEDLKKQFHGKKDIVKKVHKIK
jgi:hypothetical protein